MPSIGLVRLRTGRPDHFSPAKATLSAATILLPRRPRAALRGGPGARLSPVVHILHLSNRHRLLGERAYKHNFSTERTFREGAAPHPCIEASRPSVSCRPV